MLKSMLLEGDNLIVMQSLLNEFEGRIDVMPIDPPYNTSIDYTGYQDGCFRGGWTEFMRPRIEIAYKLLSRRGRFRRNCKPRCVHQVPDCGNHFRLRQGKAAGTSCKTRRRRSHYQCGRGYRSGDEGKETAH